MIGFFLIFFEFFLLCLMFYIVYKRHISINIHLFAPYLSMKLHLHIHSHHKAYFDFGLNSELQPIKICIAAVSFQSDTRIV